MEPTEKEIELFYATALTGNVKEIDKLITQWNFDITIIIKAYRYVLERTLKLQTNEDIRVDLHDKIDTLRSNRERMMNKLNIVDDLSLLEQGHLVKECSDFLFAYLEPFIPDYATILFFNLCEMNHFDALSSFIDTYQQHIEFNYQQHDGKNALHIACENDSDTIVTLLLDYCNEVKINEQDYYTAGSKKKYNNTPLHYAVENKNIKLVALLLKHNADPDVQNYANDTPLHIACDTEAYDERDRRHFYVDTRVVAIVKLLLEYGANPNLQNAGQYAPLHEVEPGTQGNLEIFELLLDYGASLNIKCNGKTMLYKRVEMNDPVGLQFLLDYGANPYTTSESKYIGKSSDTYYETPLMYARSLYFDKEKDQIKNIKIIQLLHDCMYD